MSSLTGVGLDLQVLGPIRASCGGVEVSLGGVRRKALLALLIVHRGEVVAADAIAEAIWDGLPPSGALGTVQSHVSHLRRALGAGAAAVVTYPPGYVLRVAPSAVDSSRFEELAAEGCALATAEDHPAALATYDAALSLWRGRPFVDLAGLEFVERESSRLEELRLTVVESRIDAILALGGHDSVVAPLMALVEDHPLRERFVGQLMVALYRAGRQADALRVFERARIGLRDELGLDPSPALRELEGAILRQQSDLDGSDVGRVVEAGPSGTVTFVFTDIEGSSGFWEHTGGAMAGALARHDEIMRAAIDRHGGRIFSVAGDGFGAAFGRAGSAVSAAIDAQRTLQREPQSGPVQLLVRIGMHTGEAQERDGTYFGHPVNVASRLMAAAHGGEIVVSDVTAAVVGVMPGVELVDLGRQRLRGLSEPVRAFGVRAEGVSRVDRPLAGRADVAGNLLRPATSWHGPEVMVTRLAADLTASRLVTFTGTGGIGKSRLAVEVADRATALFPDGVWMVDLAPISDGRAVVTAIASTLSLQPQPEMRLNEAVVDWLRDRRLLLILDNCEHVMDPVGDLASDIVAHCTHVTILVTSRAPVDAAGERVIMVPMLSVRDAVELFCDRAATVSEPGEWSERDRETIASICQRLDGVPLAIELAASRARSLTTNDILERLDDRFRLLTRGRRGELDHHQTLRATVDWSYRLLSEAEQLLFGRLSVFPGSFDLVAVEAICTDVTLDDTEILDLVDSLVAKSMVLADPRGRGTRYRLLETLRHYAEERRREHDDGSRLRSRHLEHYVTVAKKSNKTCGSPDQDRGDATFELEWDNIRTAHDWAIETADARAAHDLVELTGHHAFRRYRHEHELWATHNVTQDVAKSPNSYGWAASWAFLAGTIEQALELAKQGIARASRPDDPATTQCWIMVTSVQLASGDGERALESAANATACAACDQDPFSRAFAQSVAIEAALSADQRAVGERVAELGTLANEIGAPSILARLAYHRAQQHLHTAPGFDPRSARDDYAEGLLLANSVSDVFMAQMNLYGLVEATTALRADESSQIGHDALTHFHETRNWIGIWGLLNALAEWMALTGHAEPAAVVYGHLEAHHHTPWDTPVVRERRLRGLAALRSHAQAEEWMARGALMDRDGVVTYTIDRLAPSAPLARG